MVRFRSKQNLFLKSISGLEELTVTFFVVFSKQTAKVRILETADISQPILRSISDHFRAPYFDCGLTEITKREWPSFNNKNYPWFYKPESCLSSELIFYWIQTMKFLSSKNFLVCNNWLPFLHVCVFLYSITRCLKLYIFGSLFEPISHWK